jgi:phospholipase C
MISKSTHILATLLVASVTVWVAAQAVAAPQEGPEQPVPHYDHVFVIVDENKGFDQIMTHPEWTPVIHKLAAEYGQASNFYAEVHSSEGNYIAMVGGDTFGIHDDDAFYCKPHLKTQFCEKSDAPRYVDHSLTARSLPDQLAAKGLTWKAYLEDLPNAGSLVPRWPTADYPAQGLPQQSYAAKHNGFVNFKSVHDEPFVELQQNFVGFDRLYQDLADNTVPNYAHIIGLFRSQSCGPGAAG